MTDNTDIETFLGKIDDFAEGLSPDERSLLAELLVDDAPDVVGFGRDWPGAAPLVGPTPIERWEREARAATSGRADGFLSSGHTTGSN